MVHLLIFILVEYLSESNENCGRVGRRAGASDMLDMVWFVEKVDDGWWYVKSRCG
jgi:hypothetical protein